jgi:hypothetical protein
MGNTICSNYYCQNISFKPEWFSENSWNIEYNYENNEKPYIIDKGILKINCIKKFDLLLSKKLLIDFDEIKNIIIPINFKYSIIDKFNIFIIFSKNIIKLSEISLLNTNNDIFFINLILLKNKITILRSFDNNNVVKKIKSNKINNFTLNIENNFNLLLITEKLLKNNLKNIYEQKYINKMSINKELFLTLFIENKSENNQNLNEYIELNFE